MCFQVKAGLADWKGITSLAWAFNMTLPYTGGAE